MVYNALVLVYLYSDVSIRLPREGTWLNEGLVVHVVISLSGWNLRNNAHVIRGTSVVLFIVLLALNLADLVVCFEVSILFLKLIIAHIESVPAQWIIYSLVLIKVAKDSAFWLTDIIHFLIVIRELLLVVIPEDRRYKWLVTHVSSVLLGETIVSVDVLRILHTNQVLVL